MMKRNKLFWGLLIFCAINFAAHLYFYGSLPDVVPTHWGADGQANGWGPKSTVLIMAALPALMLILMAVLPRIDPKHQNYEKFRTPPSLPLQYLCQLLSLIHISEPTRP